MEMAINKYLKQLKEVTSSTQILRKEKPVPVIDMQFKY